MTGKLVARAGAAVTMAAALVLGGLTGATAPAEAAPMAPCGFYATVTEAFYNHCGGANSIKIRVRFNYGMSTTDIWVNKGNTNLSTHGLLQNRGMITNAWCIERC